FIFASVALNVAALPLLLHQYIVNQPHHPGVVSPDQQRHACAPQPGTSGAAARAPSTGKPSVTSDSVINLDHGDPTMFEAFWRETGDAAELVIPGWQTMSYFSDVGNVCWFMEPLFDQQVRRLHRTVGNAAVDGYHVLVGTGSTQLFMAALYALSPADADQPTSVVSTAPYYSIPWSLDLSFATCYVGHPEDSPYSPCRSPGQSGHRANGLRQSKMALWRAGVGRP
uniref:Alliinase C-terminal domain-containing protein n=1 Tax=Aegilops tauschii subsp. strangulata TaxID=200361 RepID=A0A453E313_AEGTS